MEELVDRLEELSDRLEELSDRLEVLADRLEEMWVAQMELEEQGQMELELGAQLELEVGALLKTLSLLSRLDLGAQLSFSSLIPACLPLSLRLFL